MGFEPEAPDEGTDEFHWGMVSLTRAGSSNRIKIESLLLALLVAILLRSYIKLCLIFWPF